MISNEAGSYRIKAYLEERLLMNGDSKKECCHIKLIKWSRGCLRRTIQTKINLNLLRIKRTESQFEDQSKGPAQWTTSKLNCLNYLNLFLRKSSSTFTINLGKYSKNFLSLRINRGYGRQKQILMQMSLKVWRWKLKIRIALTGKSPTKTYWPIAKTKK